MTGFEVPLLTSHRTNVPEAAWGARPDPVMGMRP
jgi:hypothetical protein